MTENVIFRCSLADSTELRESLVNCDVVFRSNGNTALSHIFFLLNYSHFETSIPQKIPNKKLFFASLSFTLNAAFIHFLFLHCWTCVCVRCFPEHRLHGDDEVVPWPTTHPLHSVMWGKSQSNLAAPQCVWICSVKARRGSRFESPQVFQTPEWLNVFCVTDGDQGKNKDMNSDFGTSRRPQQYFHFNKVEA